MYKYHNNPYLHFAPFNAADGGGAGGDDGDDAGEGDDQGDESEDGDGEEEDPEEKKYTQKDIDEAVKKRLAREKRKWQRGQEQPKEEKPADPGKEGPDADKKVKAAEAKARSLELKWACLDHDVRKDCVDDVLALAQVHVSKNPELDIEDAIDEVLKKYPQFKDGGADEDENEEEEPRKNWGQRQGKGKQKERTLADEISSQLYGK